MTKIEGTTMLRKFVRRTLAEAAGSNESRLMDENEFKRLFPAAHAMIHDFIDNQADEDEENELEVHRDALHGAVVYGVIDGRPWTQWQDPSDPVNAGSDAITVHDEDGEPIDSSTDEAYELTVRIADLMAGT